MRATRSMRLQVGHSAVTRPRCAGHGSRRLAVGRQYQPPFSRDHGHAACGSQHSSGVTRDATMHRLAARLVALRRGQHPPLRRRGVLVGVVRLGIAASRATAPAPRRRSRAAAPGGAHGDGDQVRRRARVAQLGDVDRDLRPGPLDGLAPLLLDDDRAAPAEHHSPSRSGSSPRFASCSVPDRERVATRRGDGHTRLAAGRPTASARRRHHGRARFGMAGSAS